MKILELIFAIIISAILFPIALIFNVVKFWKLHKFVINLTNEVFLIVYDLFEIIAVVIDRLGNVIAGQLFIYLLVKKEYRKFTLFGKNNVTISASAGHCYKYKFLNEKGYKFANLLNKVFGKKHHEKAYEWYLIKKNFNNK